MIQWIVCFAVLAIIAIVASYRVGWDRGNLAKRCIQCERMAKFAIQQQLDAVSNPVMPYLQGLMKKDQAGDSST